ncbi:MAG: hypothetical protein DWH89_01620 [Planctomycetota bacterium]|nr:MAG: hypothetical protein DWH89_01620 [Planctomycetota bacterium]
MGDTVPRAVAEVRSNGAMVVCASASRHGFAPVPGVVAGEGVLSVAPLPPGPVGAPPDGMNEPPPVPAPPLPAPPRPPAPPVVPVLPPPAAPVTVDVPKPVTLETPIGALMSTYRPPVRFGPSAGSEP